MKIKLVCDCCDSVFKEIEIPEDAGMADFEALTGDEIKDIILQDGNGSDIFVSTTCDECYDDLGLNGDDDFVFPSEPLIH